MTFLDKIRQDLDLAVKAQNQLQISTLRFLLANLHNAEIAKGQPLSDEEITGEIQKEVKKHNESIAAFKAGARKDLVEKEEAELEILKGFLPKQLTAEQIQRLTKETIEATGARGLADFGRVMGAVMKKVARGADGDKVAQIVREFLSAT